MMQIPRAIATCMALVAMGLMAPSLMGQPAQFKLSFAQPPAGDAVSVCSTIVPPELIDRKVSDAFKNTGTGTLSAGETALPVQINATADGLLVSWILSPAQKNGTKDYTLTIDPAPAKIGFHFVDGDGWRELRFGEQPVDRDMIEWDPNDRANTFKPFLHVYSFDGQNFITKGPGGLYTHHRGIFFGFKTQHGDFWHCPDVHQEHVKYLPGTEFVGPIVARDASMTNWVDKDNKPVVRDMRQVTTWRIARDQLIMDFDITVESLGGDIELGGDPHHAGFHFRADNEVAGADQKSGKTGTAKYLRPASATSQPNDNWADTPWVACLFTVKHQPYVVMHMDAPENPKPAIYSTRSYGRFGAFFKRTLKEGEPLHLRYRLLISNGEVGLQPTEHYSAAYRDFISPVKVTLTP